MSSPTLSAPRRIRTILLRTVFCALGFAGAMELAAVTTAGSAQAQFSRGSRSSNSFGGGMRMQQQPMQVREPTGGRDGGGGGRRPPRGGGGYGPGRGVGLGIGYGIVPIDIVRPRPSRTVIYEEIDERPRRRVRERVRREPPRRQPPQQAAQRSLGVPPAGERRFVPDEIVLRVTPGASAATIAAVAQRFRLTRLETQDFQLVGETWHRWRIPDRRSVPAVIRALAGDTRVSAAQPNYLYALQQDTPAAAKPADGPEQYTLAKMHAPEAHALARGEDVLVAVIDSGIDPAHPELAGTIAERFSVLEKEEGPHAHGTAIAGAIAAHAKLRGTAPGARILAVQAFGTAGASAQATTFSILKGIDWSAGKGARVINMSFAGPADPAIENELVAAHAKNIVLIAAAGNLGPKAPPQYPAADPDVIAVSATDPNDDIFKQSNRGDYVAVTAPGVDIIVAAPNGNYQVLSGTSFSAAHVSGVAALLLQRDPAMKADQVRDILLATARDLGPKGRDPNFGAGLVDALGAVNAASPQPVDTAAKTPAAAQ